MTENEQKPLNIYQKLQKARRVLGEMKLKKTGKNTYSNFTYYELSDFLPAINKINEEIGLMTFFEIKKDESGSETAFLDIINSDIPTEVVTFRSETADVEIGKKKDGTGGAEKIQNIGGKQTYLRRYLMIMAYEISETDEVDRQAPRTNGPELDQASIAKINSAQSEQELIDICAGLKREKPNMIRQLTAAFTLKKQELSQKGSLNENP